MRGKSARDSPWLSQKFQFHLSFEKCSGLVRMIDPPAENWIVFRSHRPDRAAPKRTQKKSKLGCAHKHRRFVDT